MSLSLVDILFLIFIIRVNAFLLAPNIYIYIYVCMCMYVRKNTDFWLSRMPLFYLLVEQCDSYLLLSY